MDSRDKLLLGELMEAVNGLRNELARVRIREEVDDERIRAAVREFADGRAPKPKDLADRVRELEDDLRSTRRRVSWLEHKAGGNGGDAE